MYDAGKGLVLRQMRETASPSCGILNLKWTEHPSLALCLDTGGSVWSLNFTRNFGIRSYESRCLFSGARGEVCYFEPLYFNGENHPLRHYTIAAFVTLSKLFVVMIKPKLRVIKFHSLMGPPDRLPLLAWNLVLIQLADSTKAVDPVLATARGNCLYFHQLTYNASKINLLFLRQVNLSHNLLSLHWMGPKTIIYLDISETVHLFDVRACNEIDSLDLSHIGLVYESAFYKGLATGGNVSKAFTLIGSNACYNSVVVFASQLYVLSSQNIYVINAKAWSERLSYMIQSHRWEEAIKIAMEGYRNANKNKKKLHFAKEKILNLFEQYMKATHNTPEKSLECVINCLVEINETQLIWEDLWDRQNSNVVFLEAVTKLILAEKLDFLSTKVSQSLCEYWYKNDNRILEELILKLNWKCLDLHQALTYSKKAKLFLAQIHLNTQALEDYTISLIELIPMVLNEPLHLGNYILVYISSCFAGRKYPVAGEIPKETVQNVKNEVLRSLFALHTPNSKNDELPYPYLRILLNFNIRETLNVITLAFQEKEFNGNLGLSYRQRIINVLLEVLTPEHSSVSIYFYHKHKIRIFSVLFK